jgi:hypothetical protein
MENRFFAKSCRKFETKVPENFCGGKRKSALSISAIKPKWSHQFSGLWRQIREILVYQHDALLRPAPSPTSSIPCRSGGVSLRRLVHFELEIKYENRGGNL